MSGGFDSRLSLALAAEAGARPQLLIQSHPDENGDADGNFAEAVARTFGLPFDRVSASADFFSTDDYLTFLEQSEVGTPSLYLFITNVSRIVTPGLHAVWDGCMLDPALKFGKGRSGVDEYLRQTLGPRRSRHQAAGRLLFNRDWFEELERGFEEQLAAERARVGGDDAASAWRFNFESRTRHRTAMMPFQVYAGAVPALAPGLSRGSWEAACMVDHGERFDHRLYDALFRRHFPEAFSVPVASGTTLYNPGGRATPRYYRQRVVAEALRLLGRPKVARALGRLGLGSGFAWEPSRLPGHALATWEPDAELFDVAGVERLRRLDRPPTPNEALAIEMLFYMEAWRHVMRGDLRSWAAAPAPGSTTPRAAVAATV